MSSAMLRRIFSLAVALVMLGAASPVPWHSHADHSAELPHVDEDHGAHDGVLVHDLGDGVLSNTVALPPLLVAQLDLSILEYRALSLAPAPAYPPSHPPNDRPPARAPPASS